MKGNINDVEKIYEEVEYRTRENFVYLRNNFIVDPIENENMQLKEEVLLDCFESLSEDVVSNCDNIADIFSQLQENRSELVLELWKSLIENKWDDILKGGDDYNSISACLTSRIMSVLVENRYFNKIEKKLLSESRILEAVYQQSPSLPPSSTFIVGKLLRQNDFENASKIMEYIYSNNKNNFVKDSDFSVCSFSYMFKMWIENYIITSSSYGIFGGQLGRTIGDKKDIYDFLDYWCDEINDEKERNRVKIYLMRLI